MPVDLIPFQMLITGSLGRIMQQTMNLRWFIADQFNPSKQLQQAWICDETGEVEWRPIEVVGP